MNLENLKLLETKVNQVLDQHDRVREEYGALLERLKEKERQFAETRAQLEQYEQERAEMKARLERILARLDRLDLT